jgi:tetratricopeptide (TPR) repeat protein
MGWSYHELGEYAQALDHFEKALAARGAAGAPGPIRIARRCVGRALRSLGCVAEALEIQRALHDELARANATDGYVDEELGECLLALDRRVEARPYVARAYSELAQDPWLAEDEPTRLERLKQLGTEAAIP